jgi:signal transduction histidine kinase
MLGKVFEAFVQADPSSTRRHGGAGLGLTLVRRLVEGMGGTCEVASRPGEGTTVSVWLPVEVRIRAATTPPALLRTEAAPPPEA